jgi:hypothetical protein
MTTVAESLVATLAAGGAKRIYGIVGDSLNGITDEIRRQKTIEWVHVRHRKWRLSRPVPTRTSPATLPSAQGVAAPAIFT